MSTGSTNVSEANPFCDTSFWVALVDPSDQLFAISSKRMLELHEARFFTLEDCLGEVLTYFSNRGSHLRAQAHRAVANTLGDRDVMTLARSSRDFRAALALYGQRLDKGYSFVDCLSMVQMKAHRITRVLTGDRHFAQEGFDVAL